MISTKNSLLSYESKFLQFDTLMQFRVKHILLVSSSYDSYVLEEDGQLTDLIYNEYLELNLTITPHVKRVSTAEEALEVLKTHDIDLVLIFKRVSDIDVLQFGRNVKAIYPNLPVILLAYHERELVSMMHPEYEKSVDQTFIWTGDVRILLSIIKLVEDRLNVDHDTKQVGVRVIILVEDSVKFYSSYFPLLYREIMGQTRSLMEEGLNISHKILRMRARPKILLAKNFEEALELFKKYKKYLLAVISDFRFQIDGTFQEQAGIKLVTELRKESPDLPILMQSSADQNAKIAYKHNVGFLSKGSPRLHNELRSFILANFGFGDFVFLDPESGNRLAVASDFKSMEKCLKTVDENSIVYHANRNHFSNWLMARTEFDLAVRLRPRKASEFTTGTSLREYLIKTFRDFRHEKQRGQITDFSRKQFDLQSDFVRIGGGSLGGKGRGLAYLNALLNQYKLDEFFEGVKLRVPLTVIIGTDVFDEFIESNNLHDIALGDIPDEIIVDRFLKAKFSEQLLADFESLLENVDYPLAVRSSSILEDSHLQTFAGVYETFMLPNNSLSQLQRRQELELAIKHIYASTFYANAKAYHKAANNRIEEEKMAVIIQKAVGQTHNQRYYPSFSGVALSYNYYSLENVEPEDGVVYAALGFGKTIVEGMNCLRFSPSYPNNLPQFSTVKDMLKNSQHEFFGLNIDPELSAEHDFTVNDGLEKYSLKHAEEDNSLYPICSTYSAENDRVYEGSAHPGARIITFAPILKSKTFPLTEIVKFLLQLGSEGLNCPVEIEFAVNIPPDTQQPAEFYCLQIRPMMKEAQLEVIDLDEIPEKLHIAKSYKTLGNLRTTEIADVVLVTPETFDRGETVAIANEVGEINQQMIEKKRKYLLIGPGRWGTTERWLGVPVSWNQINQARVIIEAAYGDFAPDPSFGTHFFQNLTAFQTGYFTVNENSRNGFIDFDWLLQQPRVDTTTYLSVIRLSKPLQILIDGRIGAGVIGQSE